MLLQKWARGTHLAANGRSFLPYSDICTIDPMLLKENLQEKSFTKLLPKEMSEKIFE